MQPELVAPTPIGSADGTAAPPRRIIRGLASWAELNLAQKLSLVLTIVLAVVLPLGFLIVRAVVMPAFERIETAEVTSNRIRADSVIARELEQLSGTTGDWAAWDDTYQFVQDQNVADYIHSNLSYESLAMFDADLVLYFDATGRMRWGARLDHAAGGVVQLGANPLTPQTSEKLLSLRHPTDLIEGFAATPIGPALISARPVSTSQWQGPIMGRFVVARVLNERRIASLQRRTAVNLDLVPVDNAGDIVSDLLSGDVPIATRRTRSSHSELQVLPDVSGAPLMIREIVTPRSVSALGDTTLRSTLIWLALLALLVIGVVWIALRAFVVDPLTSLTSHVRKIQDSGDLGDRLAMHRHDEIGVLARGFDELLDELEAARARALEQSYRAGMAEVAAGVLHNVRNTMTPLVNALDATAAAAENLVDPHWAQAVDELDAASVDPVRQARLLEYLRLASRNCEQGAAAMRSQLALAADQAREVEHILLEQEAHTDTGPPLERLELGDLVRKAIVGVLPDTTARRPMVEIGPTVERYAVHTHGITVVQIISNLIINAHEAILAAGASDGRISLDAQSEPDGLVALRVIDNGVGIQPAALESIFKRGVTSKRNGRGGLGLHWSANAADQLGGSLYASSDGPGHGACLTLVLPAADAHSR